MSRGLEGIIEACLQGAFTSLSRGGGGGGGGESMGSGPNDVMHTVIYAAFCMLPLLDLQAVSISIQLKQDPHGDEI